MLARTLACNQVRTIIVTLVFMERWSCAPRGSTNVLYINAWIRKINNACSYESSQPKIHPTIGDIILSICLIFPPSPLCLVANTGTSLHQIQWKTVSMRLTQKTSRVAWCTSQSASLYPVTSVGWAMCPTVRWSLPRMEQSTNTMSGTTLKSIVSQHSVCSKFPGLSGGCVSWYITLLSRCHWTIADYSCSHSMYYIRHVAAKCLV